LKRKILSDLSNKSDKTTWAVGGGVLLGLGVGFFLLHQSSLYFVGSLIAGSGVGLLAAAILSKFK
jgi:hypothetical protein